MLKACFSLCLLLSAWLPPQPLASQHVALAVPDSVAQSLTEHAQALNIWLRQLTPSQQTTAQKIFNEYSPRINDVRLRIFHKKVELEHLNFDHRTSLAALPILGRELQLLRDELLVLLLRVDERVYLETGVRLGAPDSRGCSMEYAGIGMPLKAQDMVR